MVTPFFLWFLVWSPIVYQKKEVSFCFLDEFFQCQVNMRYPKKPIKSRIIHKFFTAKVELFIKTKDGQVIYIALDYGALSGPLYRHSIILLVTGVISLIVLFLLTARFFNRIYENIQKIKRQIQSLEKGDLTAKSNVNDRSELENLSQSTNRMVDKLNKLVKDTQEQATKTQKLSVLLEAETSQTIEKIYAITTETTMKSREQLYEIISFLDELVETLQPYKKNEQVLHLIEKVEDMKQIANERTAATTDMTITLSDLIHSLHGQSRELSEISNALLESMKKFKL